jgi:hypothetical protein|tara:strand:- start:25 stop:204 length:180 start_codon:yes stop_codon:yes gene_type:complete
MSIELELNIDDYRNIVNWYELAFAKNKKQNESDTKTFKKVSVMAIAKMEEIEDEDRLQD